jgi:hypothetical protein
LFEQEHADEEYEADDDALEIVCQPSHVKPTRDTAVVMDHTQFTMASTVEEGEEAWFEETWNELQSGTSPEHKPMAITIMDQDAEVYPIEDDEFLSSASSSGPSRRSNTPSPLPFIVAKDDMAFLPPPSPRLRATRVNDKLDGPMERDTVAPALECGMGVEQVLLRYEILEDEDEIDAIDVQIIHQGIDSADTVYSDADDVPDLDPDEDEDDEAQHQHHSRTPWLVTPTEDVLDDFGSGGSSEDLHHYGFGHADEEGTFMIDGKKGQQEGERRLIEVVR